TIQPQLRVETVAPARNAEIESLRRQIQALERRLAAQEAEIKRLKSGAPTKPANPPKPPAPKVKVESKRIN
ncbi:MAG TPA: hypothetical protein VM328_05420, partial [Fimbriimonadaceae bacterium]|nr:hypothetical protein [Fimbriimonadaceae bacterium]